MNSASTPPVGTSALEVTRLDLASLDGAWDAWVEQSPQGNPFASRTWLMALHEVLGHDVEAWVVSRNGVWQAALPLAYQRRFGARTNAGIPLTPYTTPLFAASLYRSSYPSSLTSEYIQLSRSITHALQKDFGSVTLSLPWTLPDVRPWMWSGWSAMPAYTYVMDLNKEPRMAHSVRKHVRKGNESDLRFSTGWDLEAHCVLLRSTLERQGIWIGLPEAPFRELAGRLNQQGLAWMATCYAPEGEPLASRIQLASPGGDMTLYDWTAGSMAGRLSTGATPWLVVRMVEEAKLRGHQTWDLCGASYENVARFKAEFGGRLAVGFSLQAPRSLTEGCLQEARRLGGSIARSLGWRRR